MVKRTFGAALVALYLASCSNGVDEKATVTTGPPPADKEAPSADADTSTQSVESSSPPSSKPKNIDTSFDTEMRVSQDLLALPEEKLFEPSSATSEDDDATVITRPPSE